MRMYNHMSGIPCQKGPWSLQNVVSAPQQGETHCNTNTVYECKQVRAHTSICINTDTDTHRHTHTHACMRALARKHTHTHTHTQTKAQPHAARLAPEPKFHMYTYNYAHDMQCRRPHG